MSNMVATADLDGFLTRFRANGVTVAAPGAEMSNVIDAARSAGCPVLDIIRLAIEGDLDRIELLEEGRKFNSVLVDPAEVRRVLEARQAR